MTSDTEVFETEPAPQLDEAAQKAKTRRERLLANLAKGRKTALENRKKKAMFKKIKRQEEDDEIDKAIKQKVLEKSELETLRDEVLMLREQRKEVAKVEQTPKEELVPVPSSPPPKEEPKPPSPPISISTYSVVPW